MRNSSLSMNTTTSPPIYLNPAAYLPFYAGNFPGLKAAATPDPQKMGQFFDALRWKPSAMTQVN